MLDDYQGVAAGLADWSQLPDGTEVQLFGCSTVSTVSAVPGTVVSSAEGILVAAGGGGILAKKVRPHGGSKMDAREFLSTSNVKEGVQLGG